MDGGVAHTSQLTQATCTFDVFAVLRCVRTMPSQEPRHRLEPDISDPLEQTLFPQITLADAVAGALGNLNPFGTPLATLFHTKKWQLSLLMA